MPSRALLGLLAAALTASSAPAAASTLAIVIDNIGFGEAPGGAHVGDTIEWRNKDFVAHTATARDGSFDVLLPPGSTRRTVLKKAGEISFYCRFHPVMMGKITVAP